MIPHLVLRLACGIAGRGQFRRKDWTAKDWTARIGWQIIIGRQRTFSGSGTCHKTGPKISSQAQVKSKSANAAWQGSIWVRGHTAGIHASAQPMYTVIALIIRRKGTDGPSEMNIRNIVYHPCGGASLRQVVCMLVCDDPHLTVARELHFIRCAPPCDCLTNMLPTSDVPHSETSNRVHAAQKRDYTGCLQYQQGAP